MAALDPNRLTRNELVQLLNSTPLGQCLTRSRLDRQMNRAGRRWHDGRRIRLLEYIRWLAVEVDRPPEPKPDARAADLDRKNEATWRRQVSMAKAVALVGSGIHQTVIRNEFNENYKACFSMR